MRSATDLLLIPFLLAGAVASGAAPQAQTAQGKPDFQVNVDLVTTDAIVRDQKGQFIADLKPGEIEVFEDGVKQNISSLVLIHGGREFNLQRLPSPVQEGIIVSATDRPAMPRAAFS